MHVIRPSAFRTLTVVVTLLAWLAISHHCALAALHVGKAQSVCNRCHDDKSQKAPEHAVVCCKVLKAVESQALWQPVTISALTVDAVVFANEMHWDSLVIVASVMPTGPPRTIPSTALIFQRCHRVNAPPFLG